MRRPDAAGGENVIEAAPDIVDCADNDLSDVGNDPRLAQPDAGLVQAARQKPEISSWVRPDRIRCR